MKLVDTHVHLCSNRFDNDRSELLSIMSERFEIVLEVSYSDGSMECARKLADSHPFMYFSVGIHPHNAKAFDSSIKKRIQHLVSHTKCVAVGEVGLDFYRDLSPRDVQERVFLEQLNMALDCRKPIILHVRNAYDRILELLKTVNMPGEPWGVVHSFSGEVIHARKFLDMGFYIGIGCPVTYPKNHTLREVVRYVPLDRLLPETDSPYLPPQRFRGRRNDPTKVLYVIEEMSRLKSMNADEVAGKLRENVRRLFGV